MDKLATKKLLIDILKRACNNVLDYPKFPWEWGDATNEFPYIVTQDGLQKQQAARHAFSYEVSIIGFVHGPSEDLWQKIYALENKVFSEIYKEKSLKWSSMVIDGSSIFKPYQLSAFVFPPYAAFRMDLVLEYVRTIE